MRFLRRTMAVAAAIVLGASALLAPAGPALATPPDTEPPSTPGTPRALQVSPIRATINVPASTDNDRVAGYWVQRQVDGVWTDWATNGINTVYLTDLAPDTTYTVVVVAFDPTGNRSPQSPPLTFTTAALEPAPRCETQLQVFGQSYLLNVTLVNMTSAPVADWSVTFTLPTAHVVSSFFNFALSRAGDLATASPPAWAPSFGPGTFTFGLLGSYPVGSPLPSDFVLTTGAGPVGCT